MLVQQKALNGTGKTLIHVFPTTARSQQRVLALLRRLTAAVFALQRGFVGAALAHSVDGERIVMQTEWGNLADFRRALRTPTGLAYWQRVRGLIAHRGDRLVDVLVYDELVSFYSLGAVTAHNTPPVRDASIAGNLY